MGTTSWFFNVARENQWTSPCWRMVNHYKYIIYYRRFSIAMSNNQRVTTKKTRTILDLTSCSLEFTFLLFRVCMYVRFELSHAGTCSIWKAGSPPPMMTFWIITSTSVGGHLLVSKRVYLRPGWDDALQQKTQCFDRLELSMGVFGVLDQKIWSMFKGPGYHSFKSVVNRRKKKRELQNPTCQLLNLDQSTSWQCQKPRLYMFILLTRWFPP